MFSRCGHRILQLKKKTGGTTPPPPLLDSPSLHPTLFSCHDCNILESLPKLHDAHPLGSGEKEGHRGAVPVEAYLPRDQEASSPRGRGSDPDDPQTVGSSPSCFETAGGLGGGCD